MNENYSFRIHYHFFKTKLFGLLVVVFLAVKVLITLFLPNHATQASDLTTLNILEAINNQRQLRDLTTLNTNAILTKAAQTKSDDMQARHYFSHVDPGGHYIWDTIVADGYTPYLRLGENLAIEFYDTDSLINAWMNSPEHRANILNAGFVDQGMGLTFGNVAQGQYYSAITNTFGTLAPIAQLKVPAALVASASKPPAQKLPSHVAAAAAAHAASPQPLQASQVQASGIPQPAIGQASQTITALPIPIRGGLSSQAAPNQEQNFALSTQAAGSAEQTPAQASQTSSASAVVGAEDESAFDNYQANRYLILICGALLLALMLSDAKKILENKLGSLDKKTNNLVMLGISIIVVAFLYWF